MRLQTSAWLVGGLALLLSAAGTLGQGTFQNLDFENGTFIPISGDPFGSVEWTPAMPGWTGYIGTIQQSLISLNSLSLSAANIAIMGPDFPSPGLFHGQYYVVLQNSFPVATDVPAISQVGMVPVGSQTIQFWTGDQYAVGFGVSYGGHQISLSQLGSTANGRWMWGGDVSAFAGQTGELRFRGNGYLDNIQFSDQPIPEPGVFGLSALGALLLGCRVLGRRR